MSDAPPAIVAECPPADPELAQRSAEQVADRVPDVHARRSSAGRELGMQEQDRFSYTRMMLSQLSTVSPSSTRQESGPGPPSTVSFPAVPSTELSESACRWPNNVSPPIPPTNESLPRPPRTTSAPGPPSRSSAPLPPLTMSSPRTPRMKSLPDSPQSTSACGVPTITSLPLVPASVHSAASELDAVRGRAASVVMITISTRARIAIHVPLLRRSPKKVRSHRNPKAPAALKAQASRRRSSCQTRCLRPPTQSNEQS
jgi:hypothetical protein